MIAIREIATLFLKLGLTGFGGPAAHIAMMRQEVVIKRGWMTEEHFLDLLGATNLIPGPNSTEMAIHIGYDKGGWKGLLVAGLCFMLPAVLITGVFAWLYRQYGQLPEVQPFIYGIQPAIISIIIAAVYPLARKSAKNSFLILLSILVFAGALCGISELYLMFGAGLVAIGRESLIRSKNIPGVAPFAILPWMVNHSSFVANAQLFWICLKIGSILYGSGYVLFAFLDTELVATGMLTRHQLMDAITVGQLTPGPVFSSVTFVGYQVNGISGAIYATLAIFLPSFIFVALLKPIMALIKKVAVFTVFLDAVNVASVALIAAMCITMAKAAVGDWRTIFIMVVSCFLLFRFKQLNSIYIIIGGALIGYLLQLI